MTATLRRHGATMVERNGRPVAAHFGSPASEAAVCRSRVGLADRSDRATLEVRGGAKGVDQALDELTHLGTGVRWVRCSEQRAAVRCDGHDVDGCTSVMLRAEDVTIVDVTEDYAGIELIGPNAGAVLRAHLVEETAPVVVVRSDEACAELIVAHGHAPAVWNGLLDTGDPYGISCVGLEALEHLGVSERLDRLRTHG